MKDLISIIVPVYKQNNEYLKKCLDSIIRQTYKNIEVIIIDDGMTNDNVELLKKYPQVLIKKNPKSGVSSARNLGISASSGDWLVFVDSDDYLDKDFCKIMLEKAKKKNSSLIICSLNRIYHDHQEPIQCEKEDTKINSEEFLTRVLNVQNCVGYVWGKLWKADVIKNNNILLDEKLEVAEDAEFCLDAATYYNDVVIVPNTLYNYRVNENSVTKKYDDLYYQKYLNAILDIGKQLNQNNKMIELKQYYYNFVVYHLLMICVNYFYHPNNNLSCRKCTRNLKSSLKENVFKESLKNSNYESLSLSRKISLFVLKRHWYFIMYLICSVRNKQIR